MRFEGRVAIVTGAKGGLGSFVMEAFGGDEGVNLIDGAVG
jgi:NAD(P)-dependent dehydrogenase (short-subunit alcohol dehydrogenase family)